MDKLPADSETESWQRRNKIKEKKELKGIWEWGKGKAASRFLAAKKWNKGKKNLHKAIFKNRVMDKLPADSETESWQRRNEIKEKKEVMGLCEWVKENNYFTLGQINCMLSSFFHCYYSSWVWVYPSHIISFSIMSFLFCWRHRASIRPYFLL